MHGRIGTLNSPNVGGGLNLGPLYAAAHSRFREITAEGNQERITGPFPHLFPPGLYEVPTGVRLPFDWETLLQPLSVILPPPGNSKPELFCLNLIKLSLLGWIAGDMASPDSRLLQRNPADRHRIVLAQDEGHNFLALEAPGFAGGMNDTRALVEQRQAGLVSILATQSPSRLNKTTKDKLDDFLGVNGQEREKVLRIVGQVEVRRINRSYGRSENSETRTVGTRGDLRTPRIRANVNETVHREQTDFLSIERYGLFREGMAIHVAQGQQHRVVYCPPHTKVKLLK